MIMNVKKINLFLLLSFVGLGSIMFTGCKDEPIATISINETGSDLGGM